MWLHVSHVKNRSIRQAQARRAVGAVKKAAQK